MRLLITGGSGFIGVNAVEHFSVEAESILNLDRNTPNHQVIVFFGKGRIFWMRPT